MRFSQTGSDVASPNLLDRFAIWAVEHAISAQMATTIATPHPIDVCEGNSLPDFRVLLVLSQTLGLSRSLADYRQSLNLPGGGARHKGWRSVCGVTGRRLV